LLEIEDIIALEPDVGMILRRARRTKGRNRYRIYERYKLQLYSLVGWNAAVGELQTEAAYDTAIRALCSALHI
jgi:hypothetical protein